jgi:hypothetical protein
MLELECLLSNKKVNMIAHKGIINIGQWRKWIDSQIIKEQSKKVRKKVLCEYQNK